MKSILYIELQSYAIKSSTLIKMAIFLLLAKKSKIRRLQHQRCAILTSFLLFGGEKCVSFGAKAPFLFCLVTPYYFSTNKSEFFGKGTYPILLVLNAVRMNISLETSTYGSHTKDRIEEGELYHFKIEILEKCITLEISKNSLDTVIS